MIRLCGLLKIVLQFSFCLVLMVALGACKKTTDVPPAGEASSDKGVAFQEDFEPIPADWIYYNTDTVTTTVVKFIALDSSAIAYTWTIGAATYNAKELRLKFPPDYLLSNKNLPVKLTMRCKTQSHADTVKSYVKTLVFLNPCKSKFNCLFKGATDYGAQTDSFGISTCASDQLHPGNSFYLYDFQQTCGRYFDELPDSYNIGYKQVLFSGTGNFICNAPAGIINLQGDSIQINYRSFDNGLLEAPLDHIFRGIRK
ncbi:MAG: hypothetical protein ABIU77_02730 [Ferruginibacter sp.]